MFDAFWPLTRPALFCIDPERAHGLAITALKLGLAGVDRLPADPILATTVCGLQFPNPIGLAAGFDKEAEVPDAILALGFGFSEAGTVTPLPQPGNPKPRMFRLVEDEAVINALGFNSGGLEPYVANLKARRARNATGIVGANVGKNKTSTDAVADYVAGIEAVTPLADYLVMNISSPNTPGLRALQARKEVQALIEPVLEARNRKVPKGAPIPPLFVKIAPDLDDAALADIAEVARATRVDGLIMGNTTIARPASLRSRDKGATGGLSGMPLMQPSTERLGALYKMLDGAMPLIGVGGVASGADAYAKIRAGASLVQLYSALVYHGPGLVARIKRDLAACLRADGFKSIADAVGADHRVRRGKR